jgi:hypothetical protein
LVNHQAERGLALLRIFTGLWLLRLALPRIVWLPWPWGAPQWVQLSAEQLAAHALNHPAFWVRYLIQQMLLPHAGLYAGLSVDLVLLAGLSLAFGLFTVLGAALGCLIALGQGVLLYYLGDTALASALFLGVVCLILLFTRAGRRWGLDAALAGIKSRSLLW